MPHSYRYRPGGSTALLQPVGDLQQAWHCGPLGHWQGPCQHELVGPDGEEAGFSSLSGDEKGYREEKQEAAGTGGAGTLLGLREVLGVGLAQVGATPL